MLCELSVENFALINHLVLPLEQGLNALTGETGAGKSLIVDAVSLLIGARANEGFIRSGCNRCRIEGVFAPPFPDEVWDLLPELMNELPEDDNLILVRELVRGGRGICRINGRAVNLSLLRGVGRHLINIHGQHEHMLLLEDDKQLSLLDSFGREAILQAKSKVADAFWAWKDCDKKLRELEMHKADRLQRIDWLEFQLKEIEEAALVPNEEEELAKEANLLVHGEKLLAIANDIRACLGDNNGAIEKLGDAFFAMRQIFALDPDAEELCQRLESLYYDAEDIDRELANYQSRINVDSYRLEEVESRLALIGRLKKKYGSSVQDILTYGESARLEYDELINLDVSLDELTAKRKRQEETYFHLANELHELRSQAALALADAVTRELHRLSMPQAVFRIDLTVGEPSALGLERAVFMISANPGEDFLPVAQIASGGELSRIVLGLKVILSKLDQVPTMIFDEVDTGLSGRALHAVAERLTKVAEHSQALVVSHSAIMAAYAHNHIHITKSVVDERTEINSTTLLQEERLKELARMIAGDNITPTTLKQAEELLSTAHR